MSTITGVMVRATCLTHPRTERQNMTTDQNEPKEVSPFAKTMGELTGFKDFSAKVEKTELHEEKAEVDEALTPTPKDSSVPESATSSESGTVPQKSETPALPDHVLPTERLEAAVKESGKDSELSEEEPQTEPPENPDQESSSQDSSSQTNPGKPLPPAVAKPPAASPPPTL